MIQSGVSGFELSCAGVMCQSLSSTRLSPYLIHMRKSLKVPLTVPTTGTPNGNLGQRAFTWIHIHCRKETPLKLCETTQFFAESSEKAVVVTRQRKNYTNTGKKNLCKIASSTKKLELLALEPTLNLRALTTHKRARLQQCG